MNGEVVLLRPYSVYGERFVRAFHEHLGVRSIVVHTSWRDRLVVESRFPALSSPAVSAHYVLGRGGWPELTAHLKDRHDVVAVAPHEEGAVEPLARVAAELNLSWAQPDVLPAFRAKDSLKSLIRQNDPTVRLNHHCLVRSGEAALRVARDHCIGRFVLKPNDGQGNTDVAFFETADGCDGPAGYFRDHAGPALFEEYIGGEEYFVNGQVDGSGRVNVFGISRYLRGHANGKENISFGDRSLLSTDPDFQVLADYAVAVVRATGLVRSPFHLEAKIDESGPCLIEVGARLGGTQTVIVDGWRHGGRLDPIKVAAHDYVTDEPQAPLAFDWGFHNSHPTGRVMGVSERRERVHMLSGVKEVEQLPGFVRWQRELRIGDRLEVTRSLTSMAYAVAVSAATPAGVDEVERQVRELLHWNVDPRAAARMAGALRVAGSMTGKAVAARPRPYMWRTARVAK